MKAYNSKFRPLKEVEPSGGGIVSFMSWGRLAAQLAESSNQEVSKVVVEDSGLNIYWKEKSQKQA